MLGNEFGGNEIRFLGGVRGEVEGVLKRKIKITM